MEDNKKKDEQQALVPAENLLIFELDERLEFGTPILEPALAVLDTTACNGSGCTVNNSGCPKSP